ncbi:MAG: helix-turn-helix domain-containing protein [Actinomycetota bacterium]|nr:helix-turn-helix domain-containing protein [Actinomycetota bacterium]
MVKDEEKEMDYLAPGDVARVLHVSPKTVSRWASQGWLPCLVTLGGHRRFRREDVEEVARKMAAEE